MTTTIHSSLVSMFNFVSSFLMGDLHDHCDPFFPCFNVRLTRYESQLLEAGARAATEKGSLRSQLRRIKVREIYIIVHVGGTRCVTSSTDHYMKIHARITLSVEFIRTCIFLF
jgi:hypothetical protein